jgi:hypothetical protein
MPAPTLLAFNVSRHAPAKRLASKYAMAHSLMLLSSLQSVAPVGYVPATFTRGNGQVL